MRRLSPIVVIGALAFMAGCGPVVPREVDWASARRSDLSCRAGVRKMAFDFHDLVGDDRPEIILTLRCNAGRDLQADQLEVVRGGDDPDGTHPDKVVYQTDGLTIEAVCFAGRYLTFESRQGRTHAVTQVWWDDNGILRSQKATKGGCPRPL